MAFGRRADGRRRTWVIRPAGKWENCVRRVGREEIESGEGPAPALAVTRVHVGRWG